MLSKQLNGCRNQFVRRLKSARGDFLIDISLHVRRKNNRHYKSPSIGQTESPKPSRRRSALLLRRGMKFQFRHQEQIKHTVAIVVVMNDDCPSGWRTREKVRMLDQERAAVGQSNGEWAKWRSPV